MERIKIKNGIKKVKSEVTYALHKCVMCQSFDGSYCFILFRLLVFTESLSLQYLPLSLLLWRRLTYAATRIRHNRTLPFLCIN